MENERICGHCLRMVDKTKRFAIMVNGILVISVPLCFSCCSDAQDRIMPMLTREVSHV